MALNFGSVPNSLFPESKATGEGLGADIKEVVKAPSANASNCPIGTILPWAKTLTNTPELPAGWMECDGSVLVDS